MNKIRHPGAGLIIIGLISLVLLAAGCSTSSKDKEKITSLENEVSSLKKDVSDLKNENQNLKTKLAQTAAEEVTVYFIGSGPIDFFLVPEKRKVPAGGDMMKKAVEELVRGPYTNSGVGPALPKGSKLLGLKVEGQTATVDFNAATQKNLNVGSSGEALVIAAVVNTITEFPNVKDVQILIEGQKVESLAGHIEANKPFTRNEKVIRTTP